MIRATQAGAAYFAGMFALGFVLGTIRVMMIAPVLGAWGATFLELPVMLVVSWIYCRWLIRRFSVPTIGSARVVMGTVAFAMLMVGEVLLGIGLFDRTLTAQVRDMTSGPGLAGLAGQVAFATFPWVQFRFAERG